MKNNNEAGLSTSKGVGAKNLQEMVIFAQKDVSQKDL